MDPSDVTVEVGIFFREGEHLLNICEQIVEILTKIDHTRLVFTQKTVHRDSVADFFRQTLPDEPVMNIVMNGLRAA